MEDDEYLTIIEPGRAQTRVLGSRFFGSALPALDEDALEHQLAAERKARHDATHWCFAARFVTGTGITERSSDAGEPRGTAGAPILREIQARGIANAMVIVTRYFGGAKLGTGNLARAYADCASVALDNARTAVRYSWITLLIQSPFDQQPLVYRIARRYEATVEPQQSSDRVVFTIRLRAAAADAFCSTITDDSKGRVIIRSRSS